MDPAIVAGWIGMDDGPDVVDGRDVGSVVNWKGIGGGKLEGTSIGRVGSGRTSIGRVGRDGDWKDVDRKWMLLHW